jgi:hypothetical protein
VEIDILFNKQNNNYIMKKQILTSFVLFFLCIQAFSQTARYLEAMKSQIAKLEVAKTQDDYLQSANSFERIANAEKTEWLSYYYTGYALVMVAYMEKDPSKIDPLCDRADEALSKANALAPNNSEITTVQAMATTARMMVDNSRAMTLGPKASGMLQKAMSQEPVGNPRAMMNLAQNLYYTPEAFGGSKAKAMELMEKALATYESFQPESPLHPSWGKGYVAQTLNQWKGQ